VEWTLEHMSCYRVVVLCLCVSVSHLHRLAQAHVVCQDAVEPLVVNTNQPAHTLRPRGGGFEGQGRGTEGREADVKPRISSGGEGGSERHGGGGGGPG